MTRAVEVTELALRDGHQSLLATRMALEDMTPVCEDIDRAGYWSVECWGGATYDSCIRFLNEDPVVDRFVDKSAENGMDVFRVFDALNDIRNLGRALQAVRRTGKHAQGTLCYTLSPLHNIGHFVELAERLRDLGCQS